MSRAHRRRLAAAVALAGLAAAKGVALSLFIPPFHGPDEPLHFDYAQALAENGALPPPETTCRGPMLSPEVAAAVRQVVNGVAFHPTSPVPGPGELRLPDGAAARRTTGCGPASIYPPVWYATAAIAYRAAERRPLLQRLLAVRWTSVAWSAAAAAAALGIGAILFATPADATIYALVVVLQPMTGALDAVANSEAAALACSTAALAALAALGRGLGRRRCAAALVAFLTLGVLTKPTFLLALPTFAGLHVLGGRGRPARRLAAAGAVFALPAAVALAFALSGGERSGLYDELAPGGTLAQQVSAHLLTGGRLFDVWVEQYWGKLGWMDAQPRRGWYVALAAASAVALAGLAAVRRHRARERAILAIVGAGSLLFAASLYAIAWRRGDLLWVEGRHILVLFPAHAYLLVRGLTALRRRLASALDPPALFALLLVAANLALVAAGARRFYRSPTLDRLMAWQAAWDVPAMLPAAAAALALALALVAASWRRRRSRPDGGGGTRPAGSG